MVQHHDTSDVSTYPLIHDFLLHSQSISTKVRYAPSLIYRLLRTSSQFASAGKVETRAMANYVQAKFEL